MLILLLVQAFFVLVILCIGLLLIKKNKKINELVSVADIDLLINRYAILTICTVIRLTLDIVFVSYNFSRMTGNKCYINDIKPGLETRNIMDFILGGLFTHCLPIFIVLRIYDVKKEDSTLSDSLLAADSYTNSYEQNEQVK